MALSEQIANILARPYGEEIDLNGMTNGEAAAVKAVQLALSEQSPMALMKIVVMMSDLEATKLTLADGIATCIMESITENFDLETAKMLSADIGKRIIDKGLI